MSLDLTACRQSALQLLSRRDHSEYELHQKLTLKGHVHEVVDEVVKYCLELGYLSDVRYTASQARQMVHKGYGEQRLRQQLKEKRVAEAVIEQVLAEQTIDWFELAKEVAHKKFKAGISFERSQYAKQVRYLQYRGFNFDQIRYALQASESDQ
ncbi:recombination regulator RecX [Vibrio metoecus]|uniref:Regulatory protein RecX n=1 Tax=Vibrio metoecus TaxID=1481663 RepID=A0A067BB18_VIBMT|nr:MULTISPECIES: recombination regulator RecX [Vibrio]KDO15293.1 recombinase RecX [Vibrio metoecus]KQA98144.1 recombinase RecX [Vibrio metoecus]KQA98364.1 recombinase RecX [Vibrio metoecus]MDP4492077.1 recombination regulator RecX [Vibrio sp. AH4]PAR28191.1 recombination regulator RecX [Vibrio metoecus]